jgi:hypothetical protein
LLKDRVGALAAARAELAELRDRGAALDREIETISREAPARGVEAMPASHAPVVMTLELNPGVQVRVLDGERIGAAAGRSVTVRGDRGVSVKIVGVGTVRAAHAADDANGTRAASASSDARAARARGALEQIARSRESCNARLERLESDGRTDDARADELHRALLEHDAATARLREIDAQLTTETRDPVAMVTDLEARLASAEERVRSTLAVEKREEGRLADLADKGTWSSLVRAQEDADRIDAEYAREKTRADAIRALHRTVADCRAAALADVGAPIERAATRIVRRIAGANIGVVRVGASFEPDCVSPEIANELRVGIDQLSGGEREQVQLATRLALADVVAHDERHLVVLDDVLVATDQPRLSRVQQVLEELSARLQILVLTCHPERWRSLTAARFLEL